MRLLVGYDAAVADWVASRIPQLERGPDFGICTALGVVDDRDELVAGVVFHGFIPSFRAIEASFAASSSRWLTRPLASAIMNYPFGQLGVARVGTRTPKRNRQAREFIDRFGFKREGLIRKGFGTDDMIVSGMLASEWAASRFNLAGSRSRNPLAPSPILAPGP